MRSPPASTCEAAVERASVATRVTRASIEERQAVEVLRFALYTATFHVPRDPNSKRFDFPGGVASGERLSTVVSKLEAGSDSARTHGRRDRVTT